MSRASSRVSRRGFLAAGAGAAAGATLAAPPVIASGKVKWRMQTHWPTGNWYYDDIFVEFCDRITTATAGELEIEPVAPETIVPTGEALNGLRRGLLDAAFFYPAYWIGRIPVASHLNGHIGTFEKHEEKHFFMYEMGAIDIIRDAYAAEGVYQAGPVSYGGLAVYANRPLSTREDFRGFRIRSTGAAAMVFEKMGSAPVSIPGGELYQALQTGVVEGAHWGCISTGRGMNFHEVCSYVQQPDLVSHLSGEVMVGLDKWNSIGSDLQTTFNEIVRATSADASAHFLYHDYLGAKEFTENENGTITMLDADTIRALRSASLEVVDEFSARDPEYSGKVGALLHEFMRMTGKV